MSATGVLLLLLGARIADQGEGRLTDTARERPPASLTDTIESAAASVERATGTLQDLGGTVLSLLPRVAIACGLLVLAAFLVRALKTVFHRVLGNWERADATSALGAILIWLIALGAALSVIAGDATALVGSVGLFGLALSWALQAPIESFSGWLLNSFRGYYRIGDRIEVGDVFGDVARIDVLTTTVWEAGGPGKAVPAAQPTGALVTFPNSEVLRANIVNYTRDFAFVWDEVTFGISNRSDLPYAASVFHSVAVNTVGGAMTAPAEAYRSILAVSQLDYEVAIEPQVYVSAAESYTNVSIRYLVPARERRMWASKLVLAAAVELAKPEHKDRIRDGYPRSQVEVLDPIPREPDQMRGAS